MSTIFWEYGFSSSGVFRHDHRSQFTHSTYLSGSGSGSSITWSPQHELPSQARPSLASPRPSQSKNFGISGHVRWIHLINSLSIYIYIYTHYDNDIGRFTGFLRSILVAFLHLFPGLVSQAAEAELKVSREELWKVRGSTRWIWRLG